MHLLRCLACVEVALSVSVKVVHVRGVDNRVADDLSRDRLDSALSTMQVRRSEPVEVPRELLEVLSRANQSWSEQEWSKLWRLLSTHR